MYDLQPSLQRLFLFGENDRPWIPLARSDWRVLSLPPHLQDQVFHITLSRIGPARLFEVVVSEQCPKDAYTHLARGIRKLNLPYAVIFVVHARSAGAHLIFWRDAKPNDFHHLDLRFDAPGKLDNAVVEQLRTLDEAQLPDLFHLVEGHALGGSFYRTLKTHLDRLGPVDQVGQRALVDLLLKLIFLIFVQRKGWLNFNPHYLAEKMKFCISKELSVLQTFLKPLFARLEGAAIHEPVGLGTLPVLSGGMFRFQPENLPIIPNQWIRQLYENLVSHYSFSLFEAGSGRKILGVSPELLGHVFERLLDPRDRKRQGTFYTPSHVAERQAEAAFDIYLEPMLRSKGPNDLRKVLKQIRILDPACGSGAYLVAAFQVLLRRRLDLAPDRQRYNGRLYELKRDIVQTNLFGVDINPMAVRLAEVRLWLNMIQDLEVDHPNAAPVLPNLQHHLRPGDFLSRYDPQTTPGIEKWPKYAALVQYRRKFPNASAVKRREILNHIHRLEGELYQFIHGTEPPSDHRLQQYLPGHDLAPATFPKTKQDPAVDADLHVVFSDIMLRGGFDLILGNPPWRAASQIDDFQKKRLARHLPPPGLSLCGQADLSLYFVASACRYLKPGGHLSLLLPGKFMQAQYAASVRRWLEHHVRLDYLYDYGLVQGRIFQADTFPAALGLTNAKPQPNHQLLVERHEVDRVHAHLLPQSQLRDASGIWALEPAPPSLVGHPRLKELPHRIHRGVKTESKRHFVFDRPPLYIPRARLRPLLRGRDIHPNHASPGDWIYWPFAAGPDWYDTADSAERAWLHGTGKLIWNDHRPRLRYKPKPLGPWVLIWKYLSTDWTVALLKWDDNWIPDQTTYYINFRTKEEAEPFFNYFKTSQATRQLQRLAERAKDRRFFYYAHTVEELIVPWPLPEVPAEQSISAAKTQVEPEDAVA